MKVRIKKLWRFNLYAHWVMHCKDNPEEELGLETFCEVTGLSMEVDQVAAFYKMYPFEDYVSFAESVMTEESFTNLWEIFDHKMPQDSYMYLERDGTGQIRSYVKTNQLYE